MFPVLETRNIRPLFANFSENFANLNSEFIPYRICFAYTTRTCLIKKKEKVGKDGEETKGDLKKKKGRYDGKQKMNENMENMREKVFA